MLREHEIVILDALRYPQLCSEDVTRKGESQPCEKPAVALRVDPNEGTPYPVCSYHSRGEEMVPLERIVRAMLAREVANRNTHVAFAALAMQTSN